jgi:hypothetical protein
LHVNVVLPTPPLLLKRDMEIIYVEIIGFGASYWQGWWSVTQQRWFAWKLALEKRTLPFTCADAPEGRVKRFSYLLRQKH